MINLVTDDVSDWTWLATKVYDYTLHQNSDTPSKNHAKGQIMPLVLNQSCLAQWSNLSY